MKSIALKIISQVTRCAPIRSGHVSPGGNHYVRAANDRLRIATGTAMVVKAMQDRG